MTPARLYDTIERSNGCLSLHYTGSLPDWMEETQPAFLQRIALLVQRGQIEIMIGNNWIGQDLEFLLSEAATLWRLSIETITGSEAGFERNHQGSCLTLLWPLLLEAHQSWSIEITCTGQSS